MQQTHPGTRAQNSCTPGTEILLCVRALKHLRNIQNAAIIPTLSPFPTSHESFCIPVLVQERWRSWSALQFYEEIQWPQQILQKKAFNWAYIQFQRFSPLSWWEAGRYGLENLLRVLHRDLLTAGGERLSLNMGFQTHPSDFLQQGHTTSSFQICHSLVTNYSSL